MIILQPSIFRGYVSFGEGICNLGGILKILSMNLQEYILYYIIYMLYMYIYCI